MSQLSFYIPLFLLGNFHCLGMCGPIAALLAKGRYRHLYLAGRILGFSLAGLLSALFGTVVTLALNQLNLSAILSLALGLLMILTACLPLFSKVATLLSPVQRRLTTLLLKERPMATLLFGASTILLPCGQSVMLYSLCALTQNVVEGTALALLFALLTTPSLLFALEMRHLFERFKYLSKRLFVSATVIVGALTSMRGLADLGAVPHLVLFKESSNSLHLVMW